MVFFVDKALKIVLYEVSLHLWCVSPFFDKGVDGWTFGKMGSSLCRWSF
jgi:hypothetical protein